MDIDIDEIVALYSDTVYRAALTCLRDPHEAEDVVSEVMIKYFTVCGRLEIRDQEHLKAWFIRVAVNRCRDILKSARYRKTAALEEERAVSAGMSSGMGEEELDLKKALSQLDEKYRTVIYLYYYEQYKTEEIASLLKIPKGTVVSRLARAREKLKGLLSDEEMST
ncbi:MAG: sigma-70 family RNA polymerase sigma factor [Ruminococcus sp.]|nr:sigma-70 family RNA polymerase sigma factor [Ruminococcus sp.]